MAIDCDPPSKVLPCVEGNTIAKIDGDEHPIRAGEMTFIRAKTPHRFRNASDSQGMRILWTYASVDATRTLIETGETRSIDEECAGLTGNPLP